MIKRLVLALSVATAAAAVNAATPRTAIADDGKWGYVCCGETCPIGDACTSNGAYTCCKEAIGN